MQVPTAFLLGNVRRSSPQYDATINRFGGGHLESTGIGANKAPLYLPDVLDRHWQPLMAVVTFSDLAGDHRTLLRQEGRPGLHPAIHSHKRWLSTERQP